MAIGFIERYVAVDAEGADAKPDQVVEGVKFVGAKGVVEEGNLPFYDGEDLPAGVYKHNNEYAYILSNVIKTSIIEDVVYSKVPLPDFGNATPADVTVGVRFTSAEGLNKEGELPYYDYEYMYAGVQRGDDEYAYIVSAVDKKSIIDHAVLSKVPLSDFGNATAKDVRKGVMFTSAEGLNIEGEMEESGASINTCNITINIVDNVGHLGVTATQFENGAVKTFTQNKSSGSFSIPNVVCGSIITVVCNGYFSIGAWTNATQVGLTSLALIAPNTTGDYSANIIAYDD